MAVTILFGGLAGDAGPACAQSIGDFSNDSASASASPTAPAGASPARAAPSARPHIATDLPSLIPKLREAKRRDAPAATQGGMHKPAAPPFHPTTQVPVATVRGETAKPSTAAIAISASRPASPIASPLAPPPALPPQPQPSWAPAIPDGASSWAALLLGGALGGWALLRRRGRARQDEPTDVAANPPSAAATTIPRATVVPPRAVSPTLDAILPHAAPSQPLVPLRATGAFSPDRRFLSVDAEPLAAGSDPPPWQGILAPPPVELHFEPLRLTLNLASVELRYLLRITHTGKNPSGPVSIGAELIAAGSKAAMPLLPDAAPLPETHRLEALAPDEWREVSGQLRLPLGGWQPLRLGDTPLFVALVRLSLSVTGSVTGPEGTATTHHAWLIGPRGIATSGDGAGGSITPFRLDMAPASFNSFVLRPLPIPPHDATNGRLIPLDVGIADG